MSGDTIGHIAIDQHGHTYHIGNNPPRKELLKQLGRSRAEKMYRNTNTGKTRHVGYIIDGLWLEVFVISTWNKAS